MRNVFDRITLLSKQVTSLKSEIYSYVDVVRSNFEHTFQGENNDRLFTKPCLKSFQRATFHAMMSSDKKLYRLKRING